RLQRAAILNPLLKLVQDGTPATRQRDQIIPRELSLHAMDFSSSAATSRGSWSGTKEAEGLEVYVVQFADVHQGLTAFYFAKDSFLPLVESYPQLYDEGKRQVTIRYGDYRKLDDVM